MAGGSVPSSKLLVDEVKFCFEEKDTNEETHFASIILSSSNVAPADSQVCLAEETMEADQASITSDSSRQHETEESQILPKAEDKFGQVMDHLICEEGIQSPPRENDNEEILDAGDHSVPKGLLECMGMGNGLSADSDSDSNELPKDIKKPYSSPVGKLWGRITSHSSSS